MGLDICYLAFASSDYYPLSDYCSSMEIYSFHWQPDQIPIKS